MSARAAPAVDSRTIVPAPGAFLFWPPPTPERFGRCCPWWPVRCSALQSQTHRWCSNQLIRPSRPLWAFTRSSHFFSHSRYQTPPFLAVKEFFSRSPTPTTETSPTAGGEKDFRTLDFGLPVVHSFWWVDRWWHSTLGDKDLPDSASNSSFRHTRESFHRPRLWPGTVSTIPSREERYLTGQHNPSR